MSSVAPFVVDAIDTDEDLDPLVASVAVPKSVWPIALRLVRLKLTLPVPAVALTLYAPAVPFAVNADELA